MFHAVRQTLERVFSHDVEFAFASAHELRPFGLGLIEDLTEFCLRLCRCPSHVVSPNDHYGHFILTPVASSCARNTCGFRCCFSSPACFLTVPFWNGRLRM